MCATLATQAAPVAHAHGRFPATNGITFHPSDERIVVVRTTFGALVSRDSGANWGWVCRGALDIGLSEDPALALLGDGTWVAATFAGLARGTESGCEWNPVGGDLGAEIVIDVASDPADPAHTFAVTSSGQTENFVYRSSDLGVSWESTGGPNERVLFETLNVAPSDPSVLYLSGVIPASENEPRRAFVYRSSDGGANWSRMPFLLREDERNVILLGVHPVNSDKLVARVEPSAGTRVEDRLVLSEDGGVSFDDVAVSSGIRAFTWSPDGERAYYGGVGDLGLWRSDDRGNTFTQIQDEWEVRCLATRGEELWACADSFLDDFAVGRSTDAGATFEPMMAFTNIGGVLECGARSTVAEVCPAEYQDLVNDLALDDAGDAQPPGSYTGRDRGSSGCAIDSPRTRSSNRWPLAIALFTAMLFAIRRGARCTPSYR